MNKCRSCPPLAVTVIESRVAVVDDIKPAGAGLAEPASQAQKPMVIDLARSKRLNSIWSTRS